MDMLAVSDPADAAVSDSPDPDFPTRILSSFTARMYRVLAIKGSFFSIHIQFSLRGRIICGDVVFFGLGGGLGKIGRNYE